MASGWSREPMVNRFLGKREVRTTLLPDCAAARSVDGLRNGRLAFNGLARRSAAAHKQRASRGKNEVKPARSEQCEVRERRGAGSPCLVSIGCVI